MFFHEMTVMKKIITKYDNMIKQLRFNPNKFYHYFVSNYFERVVNQLIVTIKH